MPQLFWKLALATLLVVGTVVGGQSAMNARSLNMHSLNARSLNVHSVNVQNLNVRSTAAVQPADAPDKLAATLPADDSPLLTEPKTPEQFFRATLLLHRLARPKLALHYLQKLMATNPDNTLLLRLHDQFGSAAFLELANSKAMHPLSSTLLKQTNAAVRQRGVKPQYINKLLDDLINVPSRKRSVITILQNTGAIAVPHILQRIETTNSAVRKSTFENVLVRIGQKAVAPLLAALDSPNESTRLSSISALGEIGEPQAIPFLWFPAFNTKELKGIQFAAKQALAKLYKTSLPAVRNTAPASITAELSKQAMRHFQQQFPWKTESNGTVRLWNWDTKNHRIRQSSFSPRNASLHVGTKLARQALNLSPTNKKSQALFLAMSLAAAADHRWEKSLPTGPGTIHDAALKAGAALVSDALKLSLDIKQSTAAIASLVVLRQIATKSEIIGKTTKESALLAALNSPDPRIQFAAANAILQIDPDKKFRNSQRVVSILAKALTDSGTSTALVVHTDQQEAANIAGRLRLLGYAPAVAQTGRDGFRIAAERGDIDLVILQINTIRWPLSQTLANFRADARTAHLPIAIYGPETMEHRVTTQLAKYPRTTYVAIPSNLKSMVGQRLKGHAPPQIIFTAADNNDDHLVKPLKSFLASLSTVPMTSKQRSERRQSAAYWFAQIATGKRSALYDLRKAEKALIAAVTDPELSGDILMALSAVPSKQSQIAMQRLAVRPQIDAKIREAAALQLAYHIQKFGLLLSDADVFAIKQSLASARTNPALSTALTAVMGSLKPNSERTGNELRKFPLPNIPSKP